MTKEKFAYSCDNCGAVHSKWVGQCGDCGEWNSVSQSKISLSGNKKSKVDISKSGFVALTSDVVISERIQTANQEFNRVCGGGLVPGSIILIGGDPGVGKSTLLLQIVAYMDRPSAYISGEESIEQVCLRAKRLGIVTADAHIGAETRVDHIIDYLRQMPDVTVVIIDSIHTMRMNSVESVPGSVNQIRASTQEIIDFGKANGIVFILVGHVTKEGIIAGPKILEHMVDVVLYLESSGSYRFLRSIKNRFGSTSEVGIFEMSSGGLVEVGNPSTLFLNESDSSGEDGRIGSCIFPNIEGDRPMLIEVQTLVSRSNFQNPRRSVVGWEMNRVVTILAVLESICGLSFATYDVYVNIAGGMRVSEPAADLAIAFALLSCLKKVYIPSDWLIFGEIGLSGEIRQVNQQSRRVTEAINIGFKTVLMPSAKTLDISADDLAKIHIHKVKNVTDLLGILKKLQCQK